jgi:hypothetical protein
MSRPKTFRRRRSAGAVKVDSAVSGILLVVPFHGLKNSYRCALGSNALHLQAGSPNPSADKGPSLLSYNV